MTNRGAKLVALALALILALSFGLVGCSSSDDKATAGTDTNAKAEKLTVGLCAMYPPFESLASDNETIEGFDVDLANAIAKEMGAELTFVNSAWDGLAGGLEKGDYDFLQSAMTPKELGDANVSFSDPYFELSDVVVVQKGNPEKITTVEGLNGKVVGTQTGSSASEEVEKIKTIKENRKYEYTQDAIMDLNAGRIDAVVAGEAFLAELAKEHDFEVVDTAVVAEAAPLCAVFQKDSDLVARYNKGLAAVKANGTYDELVAKYFPGIK